MRFFQLSFILGLIAIVCALPLGQHENQHGKKLQRRFIIPQIKYLLAWYGAMGVGRGLMASSADVCRLRRWREGTRHDMRTLQQIEDDDAQDALHGHCNPDNVGLTF